MMVRQLRRAKDATWKASYSARLKSGKTVSFITTVQARDHQEATDKITKLAHDKFGNDLYYPVIKFGGSKLPAGSVSAGVARRAGAAEDEAYLVPAELKEVAEKFARQKKPVAELIVFLQKFSKGKMGREELAQARQYYSETNVSLHDLPRDASKLESTMAKFEKIFEQERARLLEAVKAGKLRAYEATRRAQQSGLNVRFVGEGPRVVMTADGVGLKRGQVVRTKDGLAAFLYHHTLDASKAFVKVHGKQQVVLVKDIRARDETYKGFEINKTLGGRYSVSYVSPAGKRMSFSETFEFPQEARKYIDRTQSRSTQGRDALPGEYGVKWTEANAKGAISAKEKFFTTSAQREAFVSRLQNSDGFLEVLGYADPRK